MRIILENGGFSRRDNSRIDRYVLVGEQDHDRLEEIDVPFHTSLEDREKLCKKLRSIKPMRLV